MNEDKYETLYFPCVSISTLIVVAAAWPAVSVPWTASSQPRRRPYSGRKETFSAKGPLAR